MKRIVSIMVLVLSISAVSVAQRAGGDDPSVLLDGVSGGPLSSEEAAGLVYMYEEEKLARDVYNELFLVWNLPVFRNIASSEGQHMEMAAYLLDRYNLTIPVAGDVPGSFADPELQQLYNDLVAEGRVSITAALTVGATIEDLDIFDLQSELALSDNDDIRVIYQNLMKGSRNHMRSFIRQLDRFGKTYTAQFIDETYLEKILETQRETAAISDPDYQI